MTGLSLFVLLTVGISAWLVGRDDYVAAPPPSTPVAQRPAEAAAALQRLEYAVRAGDGQAAEALAPSGDAAAADLLRTVVANAGAIGVDRFTLRYVDALGGVGDDGRWAATVEATWRFSGFDRQVSAAAVEVRLEATSDGTAIAGIGGPDGVSPVWLTGPVEVGRSRDTLVVADSGVGVSRYARLARAAVPVVRRVLPGWRDGLVVEVPGSGGAVDEALGAEAGRYAAIAAVTSPVGDSVAPGVPVHVLVNPEVFGTLDDRGAQVVMSHEATHVATAAATEPDVVPAWLTEGYADYVALRDVRLPLSVTAAQVARRVRQQGPPAGLPDDASFDTTTTHLGATYEASWIACTLLVEQAGEQALTRFYRGLEPGDDLAAEFRAAFGLGLTAFTRDWREALRDLP